MHPQQNDNDFFRMEKSVITKENTDQLFTISGDHIAEAILYHICYEHQYNLFGFGVLDPEAFGEKFGFSMKYLREIHDNPYQNTILKATRKKTDRRYRNQDIEPEKETYCTRIQNALFVLMNLPLVVNRTILNDDKRLVREIKPVRILNSLVVIQDKRTGKVSYVYELDNGFLRNLSNLYQTASAKSLAQLRRSGNNLLYLHLLRLRDALFSQGKTSTDTENTPTFAYLCELSGVNTNQEPKYQKRDLNAALKLVRKETELDFEVEWTKDQNGQKYCPILHFIPCLGEIIGPDSWVNGMRRKEERVDVAAVEFKHKLYASQEAPGARTGPRQHLLRHRPSDPNGHPAKDIPFHPQRTGTTSGEIRRLRQGDIQLSAIQILTRHRRPKGRRFSFGQYNKPVATKSSLLLKIGCN